MKRNSGSDTIMQSTEKLQQDQRNDEFCNEIIKYLDMENPPDWNKKWFILYNGFLFRKSLDVFGGYTLYGYSKVRLSGW